MIVGLVFSRDRALQLDACLASFARHAADARTVKMTVLYSASSEKLLQQYAKLAGQYEPRIRFVREQDFRTDVLDVLWRSMDETAGEERERQIQMPGRKKASTWAPTDLILFLVDDTVFVRPLSLASAQAALQANPDALGFSLRLGRNTTRCYALDRDQKLPRFRSAGGTMLRFAWKNADGDFGYPLEISSSLYRLPQIASLIAALPFAEPNTLESQMSLRARRFARKNPAMLCLEYSAAFSTPLNRVQGVYKNRAGEAAKWSTESLAEKFDRGLRIDVAALDGFVPSACHQEVELPFGPDARQSATS